MLCRNQSTQSNNTGLDIVREIKEQKTLAKTGLDQTYETNALIYDLYRKQEVFSRTQRPPLARDGIAVPTMSKKPELSASESVLDANIDPGDSQIRLPSRKRRRERLGAEARPSEFNLARKKFAGIRCRVKHVKAGGLAVFLYIGHSVIITSSVTPAQVAQVALLHL